MVVYNCDMDYGTMEMECMRERLEGGLRRGRPGRGGGAETDPQSTQQDEAFCCCGGQPIWPTDMANGWTHGSGAEVASLSPPRPGPAQDWVSAVARLRDRREILKQHGVKDEGLTLDFLTTVKV